jgi:hypothetical protein
MRVTEIIGQMARDDSENVLGSAVDHYSALLNAAHPGMDPTAMAFAPNPCPGLGTPAQRPKFFKIDNCSQISCVTVT